MRRAVCVLVFGIAACGANPAGPSDMTTPPDVPLVPGRYSFGVVIASNGQSGLQPPCIIAGAGDSNGTIPQPITAFVVTAVSNGAGGLILRPESQYDLGWTMTLRRSGSGVEGTVLGSARDISFPQIVTIDGGSGHGPATLTGAFGYTYNLVGGQVGGRVVFDRGGWTYSCPYNDWMMNRMQ